MSRFDYIIVGAGTAGCVLANRLSADPGVSVCLIEAGKPDRSLLLKMPAGFAVTLARKNSANWYFRTQPQRQLDGRELYWPRGRGWGGSSSVNAMVHIRGHAQDFDHWAASGLDGWSYADVLPYFKRSETFAEGDHDFHGQEGPLQINNPSWQSPLYEAFVTAGQEAGYSRNADFNGARQEGFGALPQVIHQGRRVSASTAYLRPVAGKRENLTVLSTRMVTRVLIENGQAVGIEHAKSARANKTERLYADREVIVCAGTVQSPQLLMLSGIGDPAELKKHGITPKLSSPKVGQGLQDHLDVTVMHEMTRPCSIHSQTSGLKSVLVGLRYLIKRDGPAADNHMQAGAFIKSDESLDRPDLQLHYFNGGNMGLGETTLDRDGFSVHVCDVRPESRGSIRLASANPFDAPLIDPNYLATDRDRQVIRRAIKLTRDICQQSSLSPWRGPEVYPGHSVQSNDEIDAYIRATAATICHPSSSVAMGSEPCAPLDASLKLRGVEGLRVVDASAMPGVVAGNTNAATLMLAEKAADIILGRPAPASECPVGRP